MFPSVNVDIVVAVVAVVVVAVVASTDPLVETVSIRRN